MADYNIDLEGEEWKAIPDHEGYEASNKGRVRSFWRRSGPPIGSRGRGGWGKKLVSDPQIRMPSVKRKTEKGGGIKPRLQMFLGRGRCFSLPRLIATTWIPNPGGLPEVNHLDGDPTNNSVENLEWATKKRNHDHANEMGLFPKGSARSHSKLDEDKVRMIRERYKKGSVTQLELGREFNVSRATIGRAITGVDWGHVQ